jgi:glycosyltransferase involved in cell wall biosynthesis
MSTSTPLHGPGAALRVLLVTPSFPPDLGGLAVLVAGVAKGLCDVGCTVEVATQIGGHTPRATVDTPSPYVLHQFANRLGGRRFGYAPALAKWVRRNDQRFDVIHAFSYHAPTALAVARATKKPFFFTPTFHGGGHSPLAKTVHVVYRPVAARLFRRAEVVFCGSSAEEASVLSVYPFCRQWTRVVNFAVDKTDGASAEPFDVSRPVILSAGRLDDYKRNDTLIGAMKSLSGQAQLVICGAGPDEKRLREITTERQLDRDVLFAGYVSDNDLVRWQRTATVAVSLSTHESFGLSVAEAAVVGATIVASDIPAHREVAALLDFPAEFVPVGAGEKDVAGALLRGLAAPRRDPGTLVQSGWTERAYETVALYEHALETPRPR